LLKNLEAGHRIKQPNKEQKGDIMGILGLIISFVAIVFLLVGLIPFLGWLNWFTTIPTAILGAILSGVGLARRPKGGAAVAGLIISVAVFAVALVRLSVGGGIL
jgi:hypothetical protein